MKNQDYLNLFSPYLFWDMDLNTFDFDKNKEQLIYKVVEYGQLSDWNNVLRLYGEEEVKKAVMNMRSLDKSTLSFLSLFFNIEESKFRCYSPKQSVKNFWNS